MFKKLFKISLLTLLTIFSGTMTVYAQSDTSNVQNEVANNLSSNTSIWIILFTAIITIFGGTAGLLYQNTRKDKDNDKNSDESADASENEISDTPKNPSR